MQRRHGWLMALVIVTLVVAACGPQMVTPTPSEDTASEDSSAAGMAPVKTPTEATSGDVSTVENDPPEEDISAADLPADADDWHVLGSPDAAVTIVEYADFQ